MRFVVALLLTACAAAATPIAQVEEDTVPIPRSEAIRVYFEIEEYRRLLLEAERQHNRLLLDMLILRERKDCA